MKLLNSIQRRVRSERIRRNINRRNYKTHLASVAGVLSKHPERVVVACTCGVLLAELLAKKKIPVCKGKR